MTTLVPQPADALSSLLAQVRSLIQDARQRALRTVDAIQVQTCWQVGRHIVEFEQGGAERAVYGDRLIPRLAEHLTAEFGKGFDASNLRHMRLFYRAFPICDALRPELGRSPMPNGNPGHAITAILRDRDRGFSSWNRSKSLSRNNPAN